MNYDMKLLGNRIQLARKEANLTAEQFAELCDLHPTYIRQIEGGKKTPSLPTFLLICSTLSVSPSYLLMDYFPDFNDDFLTPGALLLKDASPRQAGILCAMIGAAMDYIGENEDKTSE